MKIFNKTITIIKIFMTNYKKGKRKKEENNISSEFKKSTNFYTKKFNNYYNFNQNQFFL